MALIVAYIKELDLQVTFPVYYKVYYVIVSGFAKTVLKGTFCILRNTNLKY